MEISTGAFPGRDATPTAARLPTPASPNSSQKYSEARSAIFDCFVKPSSAFTYTVTDRIPAISSPSSSRFYAAVRSFLAACLTASL